MHVSPLVSRIKLCLQTSLPQKFSLPSPHNYTTPPFITEEYKRILEAQLEDANTLRGER